MKKNCHTACISPLQLLAVTVVAIGVIANSGCEAKCREGWALKGKVCIQLPVDSGMAQTTDASSRERNSEETGTQSSSQSTMSGQSDSSGGAGGARAGAERDAGAGASSGMSTAPNAPQMTAAAGGNGGNGSSEPASAEPSCGNGVIDPGESCDGNCPEECAATDACIVMMLSGAAATCDVACTMEQLTECKSGDGCCAAGCTYANDEDCSKACGDGVVSEPERCEPGSSTQPCPTTCDDNDPCTTDMLVGTAAECSAYCMHTPIAAPRSSDGCCPSGANAENDSDCMPACGNGVVEDGETCDPPSSCPRSCDDREACTADMLTGSAAQCTAKCENTPITARRAGDGCCPDGANASNDSDCTPRCGNGVLEPGEMCERGSSSPCPTSCDDGNPCTADSVSGSAAQCSAVCSNMRVRECSGPAGQPGSCDALGECHYCGDGEWSQASEECDESDSRWRGACEACVPTYLSPCNAFQGQTSCPSGQTCAFTVCAQTCNTKDDCPPEPLFRCQELVEGQNVKVCMWGCNPPDASNCPDSQMVCDGAGYCVFPANL